MGVHLRSSECCSESSAASFLERWQTRGTLASMSETPPARIDPLMPLVAEIIGEILQEGSVVAPVDVLLRMELIDPDRIEAWRNGELPYLERGITTGLSRASRVLRLVHEHAQALGLVAVPGKYLRRGKGPRRRLRFSKRGDPASEQTYSRHFVRPPRVET
jgi:hypothetical protein